MEQIGFLDLGQTSSRPNSDITGFNQDGREFAVVGVYDGAVLIDITSPETPIILEKISGSNSKFRDIKYWERHLYIGTLGWFPPCWESLMLGQARRLYRVLILFRGC